MLSLHIILRNKSVHLAACLVLVMSSMLFACANSFEPEEAGDSWSSDNAEQRWNLDPEGNSQDVMNEFGITAMPEFFATVELSICTTNSKRVGHAQVEVVDETGEPVTGVVVHAVFMADEQVELRSVTNARGKVTFESTTLAASSSLAFRVDAVAFEFGDEVVSVRPYSVVEARGCRLAGSLDTFEADGIGTSTGVTADGIGTSTGVTVDGIGTSTGVTADGIGTSTGVTVDGIGTSTGVTDDGIGTSTGVTADGIGTSTGVTADGIGTSTGVTVDGIGTSTGVTADGIGTSTGVTADGIGTSTGVTADGIGTSTGVTADGIGTSTGVTADGIGTSTGAQ